MRTLAWSIVVGLTLIGALSQQPAAASNEPSAGRVQVWTVLRRFEVAAIRDYEYNNGGLDVAQRAAILLRLARDPDFQAGNGSCARAAQLLSFMVTGYYEARQRREIAYDWLYFSKRYVIERKACLARFEIEPWRYHVPWWFGR